MPDLQGTLSPQRFRLRALVEWVLESQVRPVLKVHGGGITLVDVSEKGEVSLEFEGACRGCGLKSVTYAIGVREKLMPIEGVTAVTVAGVRLSEHALRRVEQHYRRYSPWVGHREGSGGTWRY